MAETNWSNLHFKITWKRSQIWRRVEKVLFHLNNVYRVQCNVLTHLGVEGEAWLMDGSAAMYIVAFLRHMCWTLSVLLGWIRHMWIWPQISTTWGTKKNRVNRSHNSCSDFHFFSSPAYFSLKKVSSFSIKTKKSEVKSTCVKVWYLV